MYGVVPGSIPGLAFSFSSYSDILCPDLMRAFAVLLREHEPDHIPDERFESLI